MIAYFIMIISILLDGVLTNYLPFMENDLSLFTPLLTIVSIFIIYPLYYKREKEYFITIFILGIIYDLLYTNLLFLNATLFVILGLITKFLYKNYEVSYLKLIIYISILIIIYEGLTGTLLFIFHVVPITIIKVWYKITHSLIINIVYAEFVYFILNKVPKKYKKIRIN